MPCILTIGHRHFLLRSESQGASVLKALSGAVPMEREYSSEIHMDTFKPDEREREKGISIAVVSPEQILAPLKRVKDPRRLLEDRKDQLPHFLG